MFTKKTRRIISVFSCTALLAAQIVGGCPTASAFTNYLGDVNFDGTVNTSDLQVMMAYVAKDSLKDKQSQLFLNADYNGDKQFNIIDVTSALSKILKDLPDVPAPIAPDKTTTTTTTTTTKTTTTTTQGSVDPVDPTYPTTRSDKVVVDQIGYQTSASKTAKLFVKYGESTDKISNVKCYVVNTSNNSVVYSGVSGTTNTDALTDTVVSSFTFTNVKTPGTYKICTPLGTSYNFTISQNPYSLVNEKVLDGLYYQRCGTSLSTNIVDSHYTHNACHVGSNKVTILDKFDSESQKFVQSSTSTANAFSGGLHDAGDYNRYVTPACQTISNLLYAYMLYPEGMNIDKIQDKSGEHISDALDEARYEAQWLLKMQATTGDYVGGFYWRIATITFPGYGERADQDKLFNQSGLYVDRVMYESTASAVGTLADCYFVFKNIDSTFANQCLTAAKKGYAVLDKLANDSRRNTKFERYGSNPYVNAGFYNGSAGDQGRWYAVAALSRATGDSTYINAANSYFSNKVWLGGYGTKLTSDEMSGFGSLAYLMDTKTNSDNKEKLKTRIEGLLDNDNVTINRSMYGCLTQSGEAYWGSLQNICYETSLMCYYSKIANITKYNSSVRNSLSYICGRNVANNTFITGFGSKSTNNIHHRPSLYAKWSTGATKCAPGFMPSGFSNVKDAKFAFPDSCKYGNVYYNDYHEDYTCNEIAIYWNSTFFANSSYIVSLSK